MPKKKPTPKKMKSGNSSSLMPMKLRSKRKKPAPPPPASRNFVPLSDRKANSSVVLDVYLFLARNQQRWFRVVQIADEIGISRSTAQRQLRSLAERAMVSEQLRDGIGMSEGVATYKFKDIVLTPPAPAAA